MTGETSTSSREVNFDDVRDAARRIQPFIRRTPVMTCATLDRLAGRSLFLKCEQFQRVGAFKYRGATNAVRQLTDEEAARGVVTHSSGNHAQALARAAAERGISAEIVMPRNASTIKRAAVEGYGARVVLCDTTLESRETTVDAIIERSGAVLVPPYDHPHIVAGQGTAALELIEEIPDLDCIVTPVGGGGLLAGTCVAAHGTNPGITIVAAEPAGADDAARSMAAGKLIPQTNPQTICDGLLTSLGAVTWPIIREHVTRVITVDDPAVIAAMRLLWERSKLIVESNAATTLAAVLNRTFAEIPGDRVGLILSGGNVDLENLPW